VERWRRSTAAVMVAVFTVGCDAGPTDVRDVGTEVRQVDVLGSPRSYRLFVPDTPEPEGGRPLVLVYHGATQSASGIELMSWFYPEAEANGLIVAFPEAAGDYWNTPASPAGYWNVPDVPFADALIEDVASRLAVDRRRIFATGFSNGAVFAQVLGCLRSRTLAGIAIVGASVSAEVANGCPWERPMPVVTFFGDRDPQFFWDDGIATGVGMLGGGGSAAWLAEQNGCAETPAVLDLGSAEDGAGTSVELWRFEGCTGGAVDFYRIRGGGHTWPGSPLNLDGGFGRKTRVVAATRVMTDFFLSHAGGGR
jgi:polyhydroxybutyrate depolymerase